MPAGEIAYVGDRLDNDVLPALKSGMAGIFLRRGPWGRMHAEHSDAANATLQIDSLDDLTMVLRATHV